LTDDDVNLQVRTLRILGGLYIDHDRLDDADRTLQAGLELATRGGVTSELVGCLVNLAFVAQRRGDIKAAIELDRRSVRELHRIHHAFEGGALANLAHKLVDLGEFDEAAEAAAQSAALAHSCGDALVVADARFAGARAAGEQGQIAFALDELRLTRDLLRQLGTTLMIDDVERLISRLSATNPVGTS
jgi:tetratricopeptide (TPR) repeat protein